MTTQKRALQRAIQQAARTGKRQAGPAAVIAPASGLMANFVAAARRMMRVQ